MSIVSRHFSANSTYKTQKKSLYFWCHTGPCGRHLYDLYGNLPHLQNQAINFVEDNIKLNFFLNVEETSWVRQILCQTNVNHKTVLRYFHKEKINPSKLTFMQDLTEDTLRIRFFFQIYK